MNKSYQIILSCISLLIGFTSLSQNITRGPYLQKGTETSVVVKWRTDSNTSSIIEYSTDTSYNLIKSVAGVDTEHEVEITGLSPGTKYFYRIGTGGSLLSGSNDIYFKTHPAKGTSDPYKFWLLGCTYNGGTANANAVLVRDKYYSYPGSADTDGIFFLGDNAGSQGLDTDYQYRVFDMYDAKLKNSIAWSCIGNHDGYSSSASSQTGPYYDIFTFPKNGESGGMPSGTESYYSFDYGNIHFIFLNSFDEIRTVGSAMYDWALSDIQNTTQKWILAFWHHPPYSAGWHPSEGYDPEGDPIESTEMREMFLPMLEDNGVDLVVTSHSLSYERTFFINGHYGLANTFDPATHIVGDNGSGDGKLGGDGAYSKPTLGADAGKGVVYVTTSTASFANVTMPLDYPAMYYDSNQYGSSVLEVDGNNLTLKFLRDDGNIDDYFTIEKTRPWYQDLDGDTFGNPSVTKDAVSQPAGYVTDNTDCDDTNYAINPNTVWYLDADGDNYAISTTTQCTNPGTGYTTTVLPITDCDDTAGNINPYTIWYVDTDGDGFGDSTDALTQCTEPVGYVLPNGEGNLFSDNFNRADSGDLGPDWSHSKGLGSGAAGIVSNTVEDIETGGGTFAIAFRKGAFSDDQWAEATFAGGGVSWSGVALRCDATSSVVWQCSGIVVQMLVMTNGSISSKGKVNYTAVEGDVIKGEVIGTTYKVFINDNLVHTIVNPSGANTSGNPGIMVEGFAMDDWSGGDIFSNAADCDDTDVEVNPSATEVPYNGIDDDCDPLTLDDDLDGDGFDNANDCDETDNTVNTTQQYYVDADGDGFGSTTTAMLCSSTSPAGYSDNNIDCDDDDGAINPGATEVPYNGIDDDCNPLTSDGTLTIEDFSPGNININPNPFNNKIIIKVPLSYNNSAFSIKIFDLNGRLVFDKKYVSSNGIINVSEMNSLEQNLYLVKITSLKAGNSISKLLIK